jgi:serine protease inhibitor
VSVILRAGLAVVLLCLSADKARAALTDQRKLAIANNNFTFDLLQQVVGEEGTSNVFLSPYSAATALQMVLDGDESSVPLSDRGRQRRIDSLYWRR